MSARSSTCPPLVAAYLRRATWPLPPGARGRARAELHAHLYLEMLDAQLCGLDEAAAWAQALRGAGPPGLLALRLARVHTLGLAVRPLLLGVALGGAAYAARPYLLDSALHASVGPSGMPQARPTRTQPERP